MRRTVPSDGRCAWMGLCVAIGLALLLACPVRAGCIVTNNDVLKMARAGLADDFNLAAIGRCEQKFDLSPDGLVELKNGT